MTDLYFEEFKAGMVFDDDSQSFRSSSRRRVHEKVAIQRFVNSCLTSVKDSLHARTHLAEN
jgi:hypothetical protein